MAMDPTIVRALMQATSGNRPDEVAQILTQHPNVVNATTLRWVCRSPTRLIRVPRALETPTANNIPASIRER